MTSYFYIDDGQNQNTFVVIDEYGQHVSCIGLPLIQAIKLVVWLNAPL